MRAHQHRAGLAERHTIAKCNTCTMQSMSNADGVAAKMDAVTETGRPSLPLQAGGARAATLLRSSNSGLLLLALVVGAGAGVGAIVFRWLIRTFTLLLSGHEDYSAAGHAAHPGIPGLGRWFVVGAPVVAGLLYGPLVTSSHARRAGTAYQR